MRKIELEMLAAINDRKDWKSGNTMVRHLSEYCDVYLHGNHIASVQLRPTPLRHKVNVNINTLLDYPTRTTLSRLRALGVDVCTRKGEVILYGVAADLLKTVYN